MFRHIKSYTILSLILALSLWGLVWFSYDKSLQIIITLALCFSYVIWGIIHHFIEGKLYPKVIFDYVAMAFLVLVILLSVIYRS